ncbi:unnamed protein product [Fusarium venenatum]|uniref:Uncharacterized protein n=1 Tax=Fusarium venenatum TaxID=56646 RepID=A0A2L2SQB1_9HYPO|nr:uncharacterized protein FVRRES_11791 [Fusarium venenatum]CEI39100.1 unnamed protein product [Fusarium venenatum]
MSADTCANLSLRHARLGDGKTWRSSAVQLEYTVRRDEKRWVYMHTYYESATHEEELQLSDASGQSWP